MNAGGSEPPAQVVVIGYGNELRGDDGVGPLVARAIAAWRLPHVTALAVHQLVPELVEYFIGAGLVVFVDARVGANSGCLQECALQPDGEAGQPGHVSDPRWLLALAGALHGRVPPARLVTIGVEQLDYGAPASPRASTGVEDALRRLAALVGSNGVAGSATFALPESRSTSP